MQNLLDWFQDAFGIPIPAPMLPTSPVFPFPNQPYLYASKSAFDRPLLMSAEIEEFLERAPEGYYVIGYWGYGVSSYAFHYSLVDSWRKLNLRLPYGGWYLDNEWLAKRIPAYLLAYLEFEMALEGRMLCLAAVECMGSGRYEIELPNGRTVERTFRMAGTASCEEFFSEMLHAAAKLS